MDNRFNLEDKDIDLILFGVIKNRQSFERLRRIYNLFYDLFYETGIGKDLDIPMIIAKGVDTFEPFISSDGIFPFNVILMDYNNWESKYKILIREIP